MQSGKKEEEKEKEKAIFGMHFLVSVVGDTHEGFVGKVQSVKSGAKRWEEVRERRT